MARTVRVATKTMTILPGDNLCSRNIPLSSITTHSVRWFVLISVHRAAGTLRAIIIDAVGEAANVRTKEMDVKNE